MQLAVWLAPHMLHAKAAIIDDVLALAGSANLDSRILFLNYELMAAFHDASDVTRFSAWFATGGNRYDRQGYLREHHGYEWVPGDVESQRYESNKPQTT